MAAKVGMIQIPCSEPEQGCICRPFTALRFGVLPYSVVEHPNPIPNSRLAVKPGVVLQASALGIGARFAP